MIERFSRLPHLIWNEMPLKKFHNITPWRVAEPVTYPMPRSRVYCNLTNGLKNVAAVGGLIRVGWVCFASKRVASCRRRGVPNRHSFLGYGNHRRLHLGCGNGNSNLRGVGQRRPKSERFAQYFIFFGGIVFPTVTLGALLIVGLSLLPGWSCPLGSADSCDG